MKNTFIIFVFIFISGCVTKKKCRERFPLFQQIETVYRDTQIVTQSKSFDTIVQFNSRDTIFIRDIKTRIETKLVRVNDSIFVDTKCPSDTIRIEKIIQTITKTENDSDKFKWFDYLIFVLLFFLIGMVLFLQIKNK
jgi:uncharacterized FlgJ-related protein